MPDQIATLGIRVDASGAISQVDRLTGSLDKLGVTSVGQTRSMDMLSAIHAEAAGHVGEHSIQVGRLERQMASATGHVLGMNSVLELLGVTSLKFGVGDIYTIAIVGGLWAITKAFEKLTEASNKTMEQADKTIEKLLHAAKLRGMGLAGEAGIDLETASAGQAEYKKNASFWTKVGNLAGGATSPMGAWALGKAQGYTDQIGKGNLAVLQAQTEITDNYAKPVTEAANKAAEAAKQEAKKVEQAAQQAVDQFWAGQHRIVESSMQKIAELKRIAADFLRDNPVAAQTEKYFAKQFEDAYGRPGGRGGMPNWSLNDGLTKEQIKTREKMGILVDDANKNADKLSNVIAGSASQAAQMIVGALNIGGGGKGSQLGGGIGGTAGFAAGYLVGGPVGGAIGSLVGNIAGSFLGGLFDHHKKAVDKNTQALQALTNLLNQPSGYKVEYTRFQATDAKKIYDANAAEALARARRGGASALATSG